MSVLWEKIGVAQDPACLQRLFGGILLRKIVSKEVGLHLSPTQLRAHHLLQHRDWELGHRHVCPGRKQSARE